MPLLGLDTDNGREFLNTDLLDYCTRERITFTRGRVAKKNDQCFVEQKNGAIVRQLVGYDRFEGEHAYRQLAELYRAVRLYVNFFQPSMKLRLKERDGGKLRRRYDPAKTPFQRLLAMGVLSTDDRVRLTAIAQALDPVQLLRQIQQLQDALWRHAVTQMPESVAANIKAMQEALPTIRFSLDGASAPETRMRCRIRRREEISAHEGGEGAAALSDAGGSVRRGVARGRGGTDGTSGADGEGGVRTLAGALSGGVPGDASADAATAGARVADAHGPGVRRRVARGGSARAAIAPAAVAGDRDGTNRE